MQGPQEGCVKENKQLFAPLYHKSQISQTRHYTGDFCGIRQSDCVKLQKCVCTCLCVNRHTPAIASLSQTELYIPLTLWFALTHTHKYGFNLQPLSAAEHFSNNYLIRDENHLPAIKKNK